MEQKKAVPPAADAHPNPATAADNDCNHPVKKSCQHSPHPSLYRAEKFCNQLVSDTIKGV